MRMDVGVPSRVNEQGSGDNHEPCEGCNGSGVRFPARPSCELPPVEEGWEVVERCDSCEAFEDDLAAGLAIAPEARWIECASGGWHAICRVSERSVATSCELAVRRPIRALAGLTILASKKRADARSNRWGKLSRRAAIKEPRG
jgi:hypothetical protein